MEQKKTKFNEQLDFFENLVWRVHLYSNYNDDEKFSCEIIFNDDSDNEIKQLMLGFNDLKTKNETIDILEKFVNLCFDRLFLFSHKNNFPYKDCSFTVYESTFESRFIEHKNTFVDSTIIDWAKNEFLIVDENDRLSLFKDYLNHTNKIRFSDSNLKKNEFLTKILNDKGIQTIRGKKRDVMEVLDHKKITFKNKEQPQQPAPEPFDLSDTSAVEKIIYLNELGIIDFLRTKPEFIGSTNLMATFLSAITDVKASTLQTSLNRLINNDTDDKNHPYRTKKTVERVRQTLIDKNIKPKAS